MYPGRELNPYSHCWPLDFKSSVSTNSTTRVAQMWCLTFTIKIVNLTPSSERGSKKNSKLQLQFGISLWSGRPGSNRPPRPWQGRALPNELLPRLDFECLCFKNCPVCFGSANIRKSYKSQNIFCFFLKKSGHSISDVL